jgi:xanthine dehydrogenase YagR molybdenum-binding subunit
LRAIGLLFRDRSDLRLLFGGQSYLRRNSFFPTAPVVDKRLGFFVNHDLAGYEVPVHADIPHQEAIFLDEVDPTSSPMKAKGVGELGICGVGAAVANAVYNATGVRVRNYPITLDKLLDQLPDVG